MKPSVNLICKAFVCFIVVMFYSSCAKDIIDLTGSITGTVKDASTNESLQGCLVSISPSGQSRTTSSNGSYSFENIDAGDYTISVSKEGYVAENKNIEVVPGNITTTDFLLYKIQPITVSPDELQFGDLQTSMEIYLKNNINSSVTYSVSVNADWISLNKTQGTISKQGQDKLSVVINRETLSTGSYSKNITIKYADGETIIPVYVQQVEKTTPSVAIGEVSNLQETSFDVSGTLTATGGLKVTQHGHCYSEKESPTIEGPHTTLGDTEDIYEFSSHITGLTKNKTYYVRAYATNAKGTTYSNQITVVTPVLDVPKVSTGEASDVTTESAVLHGVINSNSGAEITERGFYYGTTENPSTKHAVSATENSFSTTLKGLKDNTTYYYKAYAVNSKGEACGEVKNFKTKSEGTDVWDGTEATSFASGSGTYIDPYIIKTGAELSLIRKQNRGKYYKISKDIDLDNKEWVPISSFEGELDGNGKTIKNVNIIKPTDYNGIFGKTQNGRITNLNIENVNIDTYSSSYVGALAGFADGTEIENCNVNIMKGKIVGDNNVGGLCGFLDIPNKYGDSGYQYPILQKCKVVGDSDRFCIAGNSDVGGCIGRINFHQWQNTHLPPIEYLSSDVCLTGEEYVGGIAGSSSSVQFSYLSSNCKIKGKRHLAGLIGSGSDIYSSYSIYEIEGERDIAGISTGSQIHSCYSIGKLNMKEVEIGPRNKLDGCWYINTCFFISNYDSGIYEEENRIYGYSKRTSCTDILNRLKYLDSRYIDEWDFNNTWTWTGIVNGKNVTIECPRLKWEKESSNIKSRTRKR